MSCPKCGKPYGEAVAMGAAKHKCYKPVVEPTPEPDPVPMDPE